MSLYSIETLSREISCSNVACTISEWDFSTPLHWLHEPAASYRRFPPLEMTLQRESIYAVWFLTNNDKPPAHMSSRAGLHVGMRINVSVFHWNSESRDLLFQCGMYHFGVRFLDFSSPASWTVSIIAPRSFARNDSAADGICVICFLKWQQKSDVYRLIIWPLSSISLFAPYIVK